MENIMKVQQTVEIQQRCQELWEHFLIASICNDLLLGAVSDHLYLENMETLVESVDKKEKLEYLIDAITACGFGEDIREVAYQLYEGENPIAPYNELTSIWNPEDFMEEVFDKISKHIHYYSYESITDNPYYKNVKLDTTTCGAITLSTKDTLPYEFFQAYYQTYDKSNPFFYATLGFFDRKIYFPALLENGNVWMSVVVSEIESMQKDIDLAHGKVITYGLGLGYYAFMVAAKENVESVTIIEKNPDVISLFKDKILIQFPHKDKIHIIEADALEFVKQQKDGEYDIAFSDFWGGYYDGVSLYMQFMPLTARFHKTIHTYWIESCFMEYFFRPVVMKVLMKLIEGKEVELPVRQYEVEQIQVAFEKYLLKEEIIIHSAADIDALLSPTNMILLMRSFAISYQKQFQN